jgi:hypothetical protein
MANGCGIPVRKRLTECVIFFIHVRKDGAAYAILFGSFVRCQVHLRTDCAQQNRTQEKCIYGQTDSVPTRLGLEVTGHHRRILSADVKRHF